MTTVRHPQSLCRVGFARCEVTPPVGIYHRMWGAATHDQATGVHRPLFATALVVQSTDHTDSDSTEQIIIALDHVLLWAEEMQSLLATIAGDNGLSQQQIAIAFSHTHAAGLMGMERTTLPGGDLIPPYLDSLGGALANIVRQARANVQPASITYGIGQCALAKHRDFWDEQTQQYVCGFNPDGDGDDTLVLARVNTLTGDPVAVVVNYACHPTTLSWGNTLISPDFPGVTCNLVEEQSGISCLFLQGASGDLGPREGFVGDVEVAERNGRHLGYAALATLESLPPPLTEFRYDGPVISGATLGTWSHQPLEEADRTTLGTWQLRRWHVNLPYREDLATVAETEAEMQDWEQKEHQAQQAGNEVGARDCRAMIERKRRNLVRLRALPTGPEFPFPVTLWQMGDALWLFVEAELYCWMQKELRSRFPNVPLMVTTLTNGSRPSYLPTKDAYGKGIYQETISSLACGSLETLVEAIAEQIRSWNIAPK